MWNLTQRKYVLTNNTSSTNIQLINLVLINSVLINEFYFTCTCTDICCRLRSVTRRSFRVEVTISWGLARSAVMIDCILVQSSAVSEFATNPTAQTLSERCLLNQHRLVCVYNYNKIFVYCLRMHLYTIPICSCMSIADTLSLSLSLYLSLSLSHSLHFITIT